MFEIPAYGSAASRLSRLSAAHPSEVMPAAEPTVHAQQFQRTDFEDDDMRDYQVFYCDVSGNVQGPFAQQQIKFWFKRGQLDAATVVGLLLVQVLR